MLYTISLCAQREHAQCCMFCMLRRMWTWSIWSLTRDVNKAWECDTPTVPVRVEYHLTVTCASKASTRSCNSRCQDAAGGFCTSFPTVKGTGGMDTLAAYSANTLHRAGKQGWAPPLSIAQGRSSPRSPTMATAITAWLHKPGRGPAKCS